jgi:hypothetical protein
VGNFKTETLPKKQDIFARQLSFSKMKKFGVKAANFLILANLKTLQILNKKISH